MSVLARKIVLCFLSQARAMEHAELEAGLDWPVHIRCQFSKLGKIRFTSHRDVARMWERALRRSGLEVAYSEGFVPHPLLSFGLALPTGCESVAEYIDIRLGEPMNENSGLPAKSVFLGPKDLEQLAKDLSELLPDGIDVSAIGLLGNAHGSLQQEVTSCVWELEVIGLSENELRKRVSEFLAAQSIPIQRERKGRQVQDDLRPAVLSLFLDDNSLGKRIVPGEDSGVCLGAECVTQPRGVRPSELIQGLDSSLELVRARRIHQWIERDGARIEPLDIDDSISGIRAFHARKHVS